MNKTMRLKIAVDLGMTILLFVLMAYQLTGDFAHEWAGAAMFLLFIAHHILNRRWFASLGKGRWSPLRILQAAVDFLSVQDNVDPERIGIIGICGWGGMAVNTAAIDTRIKATVAVTMYDMARVNAKGYFDSEDSEEARYEKRAALNAQRTADYRNGSYERAGGVVDPLPEDAPFFVKDYHDYYKTERGYHKRSLNSNEGWNTTGRISFLNQPILQYSGEIRSAVLLVHGEKAHSCYFSKDVFQTLKGDNKELLLIPGAVHTDLYDQMDVIPFDKIDEFFQKYLK